MAYGGPLHDLGRPRRTGDEGHFFGDGGGFGDYYEGEYGSSGAGGRQQDVGGREAAGFLDPGDSGTGAGAMFGTSDEFSGGGFLMQGFEGGGFGASHGAATGRMQQQNAFAPVKIGALMRAFALDPSAHEICLAPPPAPPLYIVRIVGRLSRIEDAQGGPSAGGKQEQHPGEMMWDFSMGGRVSFEVEDGSGVLDCDWHLGDDVTPYKQRAVESTLQLNRYVRIYGQLSLLGKPRPSLRVHAVRPVTSAVMLLVMPSPSRDWAAWPDADFPRVDLRTPTHKRDNFTIPAREAELLFHEVDCCSAFLRMKYAGDNLPDPYEASLPQQQQQQQRQQQPLQTGPHQGTSPASRATSATSVPQSLSPASRGNPPAKDMPPQSSYAGSGRMPQPQEFQQQQEQLYGEDEGHWRNDPHFHRQQQQFSHVPPKQYC